MKSLVVYDSYFGNTEKVAETIGKVLEDGEEVRVLKVDEAKAQDTQNIDLLVVGSPTRAFRPTKKVVDFVSSVDSLEGVKVAAFDTRIAKEDTKSGFLQFMIKLFGYAADPLLKKLKSKGGEAVAEATGFAVKDTEGPLRDSELDRVEEWAKNILLHLLRER